MIPWLLKVRLFSHCYTYICFPECQKGVDRKENSDSAETDSEIVEHRGLMEVAEGCEVVLTHEDVRISKWRQTFGINGIIQLLWTKMKLKFWK